MANAFTAKRLLSGQVQVVPHGAKYSMSNHQAPSWACVSDRNRVRIISTPVRHYETLGPVAYRLEWNGLSVVYSGDMRPNPEFEDLARNADLVILQNMGPIADGGDISKLPYSSQYLINVRAPCTHRPCSLACAGRPFRRT